MAAQSTSGQLSDLKKGDEKALKEIYSLIDFGKFDEAKEELNSLIKKYPAIADLYYLQGQAERNLGNYAASLQAVERGIGIEGEVRPAVYRNLAEISALTGDYNKALANYILYEEAVGKASRSEQSMAKAKELVANARIAAELASKPVPFSPQPLGNGINTVDNLEYFPHLSVDGKRLVFTRRVNKVQEDFYESRLADDGTWANAIPLAGINTELNEGAQTISADGKYLVFTGCGRQDGEGSCDLYFSEWDNDRWSEARNMGKSINTTASESQPSLSSDGRLLFFTSNRPGGRGKDDLYVSGRSGNGAWSKPVNLGPTINTAEHDRYPFWSADNKTLYFTSEGHPGMGGADLFLTFLDAKNRWQEPVNLGYPINTAEEETNLFIGLNGTQAYFSKGTGEDVDIYSFDLPDNLRPTPATYVRVKVLDAENGQPLQAEIRLQPLDESGPVSLRSTDKYGDYLTVLPLGVDYGFSIEREGYLFYSDRFVLADERTPGDPFELTVPLQPIQPEISVEGAEEDGAIVLKNVFFESGSDRLVGVSTEELDRLAAILKARPDVRVEIAGHTDDVGSEEDNQLLSEQRAASVKEYLVSQDLAPGRIQTVGYGESKPLQSNESESGRALNRRTTFRLLF